MATSASQLREFFDEIDEDGSGALDAQEVGRLSALMGKRYTQEELDKCMADMCGSSTGEVQFSQFEGWWQTKGSKQHTEMQLRSFFAEMDADNSGSLDREEVWELSERLGKKLDERELTKAVSEMDKDGGGEVEIDEFLQWWREVGSKRFPARFQLTTKPRLDSAMNAAQLRELFDDIDADGSGSLDRDEILQLAMRLGKRLSATELDGAMKEMDTDGDEEVSFDEFRVWWERYGSKRRGFAFQDSKDQLSEKMERRSILGSEADEDFQKTGGESSRFRHRQRLKQQLTKLQSLRWGNRPPSRNDQPNQNAAVVSIMDRRAALGPPPERVLLPAMLGRAGEAALRLHDAQQACADAEWALALARHGKSDAEIELEMATEKLRHRKAAVAEVLGRVDAQGADRRAHKAAVAENDVEMRLRRDMGQGKTEVLIRTEREELEGQGEKLEQALRMLERERREKATKEKETVESVRVVAELCSALELRIKAALEALDAAAREAQRVEELERGVRTAETASLEVEATVEQWQRAIVGARLGGEVTTAARTECTARVREAQQALWDVKEQLRTIGRKAAKVEVEEAAIEAALRRVETDSEVAASEELVIGDRITQSRDELAWREKLKGDGGIVAGLKVQISEGQVALKECRRQKQQCYDRKKELSRRRRQIEKGKLASMEEAQPVMMLDRKCQRTVTELEANERALGAQSESHRAAGQAAEKRLVESQQSALNCRRQLQEQKRMLVVAARKHAQLDARRNEVQAQARQLRGRFEEEHRCAEEEMAAREAAGAQHTCRQPPMHAYIS